MRHPTEPPRPWILSNYAVNCDPRFPHLTRPMVLITVYQLEGIPSRTDEPFGPMTRVGPFRFPLYDLLLTTDSDPIYSFSSSSSVHRRFGGLKILVLMSLRTPDLGSLFRLLMLVCVVGGAAP
ncbi:hypothetical protein B296_00008152 [Ensete ventricosum]|uniref:Uncharacterized protein n=1 Tax=Ensete ventricosum TaxID=4639 RepID=A0A426ZYT0_ENSVE|nr:hypothetical protein B296_00008152 [Ensete ventricosum]